MTAWFAYNLINRIHETGDEFLMKEGPSGPYSRQPIDYSPVVSGRISSRCVAPLKTAAWFDYDKQHRNAVVRCKYKAQPDSQYCGTHRHMGDLIESIVWKEDIES